VVRSLLVCVFSVLAFALPTSAQAQRMGLSDFIEEAQKNGAQLGEQQAKVEFASARSDFAKSKSWFGGNLTALVAPVPGAEGDAVNGRTEWDSWGLLSSVQLELFQPIYSFGAISSGQAAAQAGLKAEQALLERDRLKLVFEVAELYFGYQMAFEFIQLTAEAADRLDKAMSKLKSPSQRDQLVSVINEIKIRRQEAEFGRMNAKRAMAWKIGKLDSEPQWDRANLVPRKVKLKKFEEYLQISKDKRPERMAITEAVKAKKAMYDSQRAQYLPVLVVGAKGEFSHAPHRENQSSPFANDMGNKLEGAVGVGIRWNLGFNERSSEIGKARAEWMEAEARLRHLDAGMNVELYKAYNDLLLAEQTVELRAESVRAARRLVQDFAIDQEISSNKNAAVNQGTIQKFATYLAAKRDEIDSVYKFNLATHRLEQLLGTSL
jgi:outer membrane protein TolC